MKSYTISTEKNKMDVAMIHEFLSSSYWAKGRTREEMQKIIDHSFCFGIFENDKQIGFARVVTDFVVFAYLADVFILEEYRGKGISKQLMQAILEHDQLKDIKKWMLGTRDAHKLYEQFGFRKPAYPERWMERILDTKP